MLVKLTDWMIRLVSKLSDEQIQDMLRSEHGGLNETFADVAAITGDKRYLKINDSCANILISSKKPYYLAIIFQIKITNKFLTNSHLINQRVETES